MYLFGIIGLIIGLTLGVFITRLKTNHQHQQKTFHNYLLEQKIKKLEEHHKDLENYFHHNITLLNTIINHCQELYQNMSKNSNILSINQKENFRENLPQNTNYYNDSKYNSSNNKPFLTKEPRDYPKNNNYSE